MSMSLEQQQEDPRNQQQRLRDGKAGPVYLRVIHRHHPLQDEIVKGLWQVGGQVVGRVGGQVGGDEGMGEERMWLVEGNDGWRLRVPAAWVERVGDWSGLPLSCLSRCLGAYSGQSPSHRSH